MKLISVLAAGVTLVAGTRCFQNELYICPVGKNKADRVLLDGSVDNSWITQRASRNYKIKCPKNSYIEVYDDCDNNMVSRRNGTSWCDDWPEFLNEKASLTAFTVDEDVASLFYRKKCDGKRSCKVNYKKDTKKMGAPKENEVEIYLSWDCSYNDYDYSKKAIKKQRKTAVNVGTSDSMDDFWTWFHQTN